uniref:Reverse transcriptase domain-containing protein n=1 Tax=Cannabis sativa TaxID=3483 RepID=A0A803PJ01_CANSA
MGKEGFMALKLGMSKAYDRVGWTFLEAMLTRMGFGSHFVALIMSCVTTVSYNVTYGGRVMGPIHPGRGIRQGDPLSPYLFLVCAEGLSSLLKHYEQNRWLNGCQVARGAPRVSHMLFADDSYVYCKAKDDEAERVLQLFNVYQRASGQQVNQAKSSIFFSKNTNEGTRDRLCNILGMNEAMENNMYLGLPCTMGRNKNAILGFLKDKLQKKIFSWESSFLSKAGKEVLLKSVAQALPCYAMNVFLLTQEICSNLEGMMSKFCMIYKARYYPTGTYLTPEIGPNPSFIWRSILEAKELVCTGARRSIGGGTSVSILRDPWLPHNQNPYILSSHPALVGKLVSNLFSVGQKRWDIEVLNDLFEERDKELIMSIQLSDSVEEDLWFWNKSSSGFYTIKSAYSYLQQKTATADLVQNTEGFKKLRQLDIPQKVQHFLWRATSGCLPTKVQLNTKHVNIEMMCPFCNLSAETIYHILLGCSFSHSCWSLSVVSAAGVNYSEFNTWLFDLMASKPPEVVREAAMVSWKIWTVRNELVWNDKTCSTYEVVRSARVVLDQWLSAQSQKYGALLIDDINNVNEHWQKPMLNTVKVNVDGAFFKRRTSSGLVVQQGIIMDSLLKLFLEAELAWFNLKLQK